MITDLNIIMRIWITLLGRPVNKVADVLNKTYGSIDEAWFAAENDDEILLSKDCFFYENFIKPEVRTESIKIYEECINNNIKILTHENDNYPLNLKYSENKPYLLYYKGSLPAEAGIKDEYLLGVVGSRRCSAYGRVNAYQFSKSLSECGMGIISGMARGIDGEAHKGAIASNGYTVAVLGSGIECIYPKEHVKLFEQIAECGCVISEFPPKTPPLKSHFPARNRIISGMSRGVLVVEATENSGAMITVNYALNEGKNIFAIPGNINSANSFGCNFLIKQGAICTTSYGDILEEFNISCDDPNKVNKWILGLTGAEAAVAEAILEGNYAANDISCVTGRNMGNVLSALTMLEIKGIVTKGLDGAYIIKK